MRRNSARLHRLLPHPHLETLLESAVLTLVPMMLIYGTVLVAAASVGQVPPDRPLEEALAALTSDLAIVFARTLVRADNTDEILAIAVTVLVDAVPVTALGHVGAGDAGGGGGDET